MTIDYGEDLSCVTDIDGGCAVVTGRTLLAQAIARRLITPRGRLIDDPNYGTDITDLINDDITPAGVGALKAAISAECEKDERVISAAVTITAPASGTGAYAITIALTDGAGPFDLVLSVSDVTVDILSVGP